MGLWVELYVDVDTGGDELEHIELFSANITHNLGVMADVAGIYEALWNPPVEMADELIEPLEKGLKSLKENPEIYKKYNASNGWGVYEHFVPFVEEYLDACKQHPKASVRVSR